MAVLVEALSVVVRRDAIDNKMDGGWERFKLLIPNSTFCHDDEVARVGFLDPDHVGDFIDELNECGLTYIGENGPEDLIVCDQQTGPVTECEWIEFARLKFKGGKIGAAWLWEGPRMGYGIHMHQDMKVVMPPGWEFKGSLSDEFHFVPLSQVSKRTDN